VHVRVHVRVRGHVRVRVGGSTLFVRIWLGPCGSKEMDSVVDPGKGVCAGPVNGGAILGKGGTSPQRREQGASVGPGQGKG
jgi:hypothetical protein